MSGDFNPRQAIEVNPDEVLFAVTVDKTGAIKWKQPEGTDDVYFRGMMDKVREVVLAEMAIARMGQRRVN